MTWRFAWSATGTVVKSFVVHDLPAGSFAYVTCKGKGCAFKRWRWPTASSRRACRKHRCKTAGPDVVHGELDLTRLFKAKHLDSGAHIVVSIVQAGWVGKDYEFTIQKNKIPTVKVTCLVPGSISAIGTC
jgi:hypothetical protein